MHVEIEDGLRPSEAIELIIKMLIPACRQSV